LEEFCFGEAHLWMLKGWFKCRDRAESV